MGRARPQLVRTRTDAFTAQTGAALVTVTAAPTTEGITAVTETAVTETETGRGSQPAAAQGIGPASYGCGVEGVSDPSKLRVASVDEP